MEPTERTPLRTSAVSAQRRSPALLIAAALVAGLLLALAAIINTGVQQSGWKLQTTAQEESASFAVASDVPFVCDAVKQDAGYITLPNKKDDHYFYWYFESRRSPENDPLVLWLTGGAGCSSLLAMLTENGPCRVLADNVSTELNPHSWNNEANVIWLDQPTGTGFSYAAAEDFDNGEDDVQVNLYWFLQGFLDKHPELVGRPLFITGESYAGHYIPAAARYIWEQNSKNATASALASPSRLNLQGIALGNSLVNLVTQTAHSLDMTENAYNISIMTTSEIAAARAALPKCIEQLEECRDAVEAEGSDLCADAMSFCGEKHLVPTFSHGRDPHDIRRTCDAANSGDCDDLSREAAFLNSDRVRAYLGVRDDKKWQECSAEVAAGFGRDIVQPFDRHVADLLDHSDVRVLVYAGDADLVCNWHGCLAWLQELEWNHQSAFNSALEREFVVQVSTELGKISGGDRESTAAIVAGTVSAVGSQLTFVRVFNAGHMVPRDQPEVGSALLSRFVRGEEF